MNDDVEFWGSQNKNCNLPTTAGVVVKSLKVRKASVESGADYTGVITIHNSITLTSGASSIDSPAILVGSAAGAGTIDIIGQSDLFWRAGTLSNLRVDVALGCTMYVEAAPAGPNPVQLNRTAIHISGTLNWTSGNVTAIKSTSPDSPKVQINNGAVFNVLSPGGRWGGAAPEDLIVDSTGLIRKLPAPAGTSTLAGTIKNYGTVEVFSDTLAFEGPSTQYAGVTRLLLDGTLALTDSNRVYHVHAGDIEGTGTIQGNLVLGQEGNPVISPGIGTGVNAIGVISIAESLHIWSGSMVIDVKSKTIRDLVTVGGYAAFGGTANAGKVVGRLTRPHDRIPGGVPITFMTFDSRMREFAVQTPPPGWSTDKDNSAYWFITAAGEVRGQAGRDENGNGAFEPGLEEVVLPGVAVTLYDDLDEEIDATVTDANGLYAFADLQFGDYTVRFTRPAELRPVLPHSPNAGPYNDSDADFGTLIAAVTLSEADPYSDPDADVLFRPLTAANDLYSTGYVTPVSGNVLDNDPPTAGDTLTVTPGAGPAHGSVALAADGSFTYTPAAGFYGTDTFGYVVTDSFGHTATGLVTVVVAAPPMTTISGYIWRDLNGNGLNDDEPGVYSVTVQLLDGNGNVVASVLTGNGSVYFVFDVLPGTYRIRVLLPEGYVFTTPGGDSDVDEYGYSPFFTTPGGEFLTVDAGMLPPA